MLSKKNILVYVNNEFAGLEMASLMYNKNYNLTVVIEFFSYNESVQNIFKIFSVLTKKIYLFKLNKRLIRFSLKSIASILNNYEINKLLSYRINNFHKKNNIIVNIFDEVWFTNDTSSKFSCINYKGKKKYFFHALIDMRNLKKLNPFKFSIKSIECFVDRNFFKIIPIYYNFFDGKYFSIIDRRILKKKSYYLPNIINFQLYQNFVSKFYSTIKIKKNKKKIILINAHTFVGYDDEINMNYFKDLCKIIYVNLNNVYVLREYKIVLKFKAIVNLKTQKMILKIFKKSFKFMKIETDNMYYKGHLPIEIFAFLIKPKVLISLNTTGDLIIKKLIPQIKIFNISYFFSNFWFKNKNSMNRSHYEVLTSMFKFNTIFDFKFQKILFK